MSGGKAVSMELSSSYLFVVCNNLTLYTCSSTTASIEPDSEDEYGYTLLDTIKIFKDSGVQCSKEGDKEMADSSQVLLRRRFTKAT